MDISDWKFSGEEESAAAELAGKIEAGGRGANLPVYESAVAIDGPATKDRDDAINFRFERNRLIVETYIADPTRFIPSGDILDKAAARRVSTLYFPKENYPMYPRCLSEDALSLNEGRANPAIKISTAYNKKSGVIESITCEKCMVKPQNMTYADVSLRIGRRDPRFKAWNDAALWLRSIREKNARHVVLPEYDPESGIMRGEDGSMEYVSPQMVNAHNIVQEAMIATNHSCALLMSHCFDSGVYRTQKKIGANAHYENEPAPHASVGLQPYTHATSPIRRYADIMVHRYLSELGERFELDLASPEHEKFALPFKEAENSELLKSIDNFSKQSKKMYHDLSREAANRWLDKVFPDTDIAKLREFDPIGFSLLLQAAVEGDHINRIFADELQARIKGKGGLNGDYGLDYPKDAVSVFRYPAPPESKNHELWGNVRQQMMEKLAANPARLDEAFEEFMRKVDGKYYVKQAHFITRPHSIEPKRYNPTASAVVADIDGKSYTTEEFVIGFSPRTSENRAKLEFMKEYATSSLAQSREPRLPSPEKVYVAKRLYLENVNAIKQQLQKDGYEVSESTRSYGVAGESPRGYKYEVKIVKNAEMIISVVAKRDNREEAERIGLETAILELRSKGRLVTNPYAHTGLATFTGRVKRDGDTIKYGNVLVVAPKQTRVIDPDSWREFTGLVDAGEYLLKRENGSIHITAASARDGKGHALEKINDLILDSFPKVTLMTKGNSIIIKNPPEDLRQLCSRSYPQLPM